MPTLPRPGVEVVQELVTTTPVVVQPVLPPCVVGPCFEILELKTITKAFNPNAKVSAPATIVGDAPNATKDVAELTIKLRVNEGAEQTLDFPSSSGELTNSQIITQVGANLTGVKVTKNDEGELTLISSSTGDGASLLLLAPVADETGTAGADNNDTTHIDLDGASSAVDGHYIGHVVEVNGEFRTISAYDGGTNLATVSLAFSTAPVETDAWKLFKKWWNDANEKLGWDDLENVTVFGASSYQNQALTLPFSELPAERGDSTQFVFDSGKIQLFIDKAGATVEMDTKSAPLINAQIRTNFVSGRGYLNPLDANAGNATDLHLVSRPGVSFSKINVVYTYDGAAVAGAASVVADLATHTITITGKSPKTVNAAAEINANAEAKLLVEAFTGIGGADEFGGASATSQSLAVWEHKELPVKHVGHAFDDSDGDTLTPFFYSGGRVAQLTTVETTENKKLTFVARGLFDEDGKTLATAGNFHGVEGNTVVVKLITGVDAAGNAEVTSVAGGVVTITFDTNATAKAIKDAVVDSAGEAIDANAVILVRTHGDELGIPTADVAPGLSCTLMGGVDPFNFKTNTNADAAGSLAKLVGDVPQFRFAGLSDGDKLTISVNGAPAKEFEFTSADDTLAKVQTVINVGFPTMATLLEVDGTTTGDTPGSRLKLEVKSGRGGVESSITLGGSAAEKIFGDAVSYKVYGQVAGKREFTGTHEGAGLAAQIGDEVWDGSVLLGRVTKIDNLPNGSGTPFDNARLKLDREISITKTTGKWWIKAKNLTTTGVTPDPVDGESRPTPSLIVLASSQTLEVTQNQARTNGLVQAGSSSDLYAAYTALRKDVSASAKTPALLQYSDITEAEKAIGPFVPANPLGFGVFSMMLNSGNATVSAIGIDETSVKEPDGTHVSYLKALEYLETKQVYVIAPLTPAKSVHDSVSTHCLEMSKPAEKHERICFLAAKTPSEKIADLLDGGKGVVSDANVITMDPTTFNMSAALEEADLEVSASSSDFKKAGVYVEIKSKIGKWLVKSVAGDQITVAVTGFDPGDNDDSFFSDVALDPSDPDLNPAGDAVSMFTRGAKIDTDTAAGRLSICGTMSAIAESYASRRSYWLQPDTMEATVGGQVIDVPTHFLSAAYAGMVARQHPAQGFTNLPVQGFTRPVGSNDTFTEKEMAVAAYGGTWWMIQEVPGGAVSSRHQLSTDTSSIEARELSITKSLDFVTLMVRTGVRRYIGVNNVNVGLLEEVSTAIQGILQFLQNTRVVISAAMNNIVQSDVSPDLILVDISVKVSYPANTIRITLVV